MHERQTELDVDYRDRGTQLAMLCSCRVGDAIKKLILRTIDHRVGSGRQYAAWAFTSAELADECETSRTTIDRRLNELIDDGLVIVTDNDFGTAYAVDHAALDGLHVARRRKNRAADA